jgi:acetyl-CoA C-acetyltransferase
VTPNDSGPNGHVYIVSAARTPIGKFGGALSSTPAIELGGVAIRAAVDRAGLPDGTPIDEVLMGQVLQAGLGQATARRAGLAAGLPDTRGSRSSCSGSTCRSATST